jgi:imidazolonepropionase-like amidohydrolase
MKRNIITCLLALLLTACAPDQSYDLVVQDVGLFDGVRDLGIVNIAINADTIAAISKSHLLSDSVVDGTGKYVVPGLVNSHVHIWEPKQLKEGYQAGILANMGMHASNHSRDSTLKALGQDKGYPFYYTAGVAATVPGGHPTQITPYIETVNDTISIEQFVNNRISEGVDYIKLIKESSAWFEFPEGPPSLPYDSIEKIIEYTHSKGMKIVVHIGSLEEIVQIARLKPDGFAHMWYSSNNSDLTDEKLKIIKESGAFIIPTALVNEKAILIADKEGGPFVDWAKENFLPSSEIKESIRKVHEAGITLLAGTDNGNFDLNWGDDLINELIIYSQCRMSNVEVLQTATGNPAKAWGIPVGFLQVGSKANMLLLNGNPIEDLEKLRNINAIWKNGIAE